MTTPNATYTMRGLGCGNCGWSAGRHTTNGELAIPRGQAVGRTPCPRCGCQTLTSPVGRSQR